MYYRLVREGNGIVLERDEGSHSCGESRCTWKSVETWDIKDFLNKVIRLTVDDNACLSLGELP